MFPPGANYDHRPRPEESTFAIGRAHRPACADRAAGGRSPLEGRCVEDLAGPLGHALEQADREVRFLPQELAELRALDPYGLERRLGDDGPGPRVAVQQRELAEEL